MDFDERQLRAFLAIADTGSLGRASRMVNLTQPSLSRQIQSMEQRLGHRLFDRGSKGMMLTQAGSTLLPHARHLVGEMEATRHELAALVGLKRGAVRLGAAAAVLRTLVAETVGKVLAETPLLSFDLIEAVDGELLEALLTRRIDIAITAQPLKHRDVQEIGTCAYDDAFAAFCASSHPIGKMPTFAEAMRHGWVMPSSAFTPRLLFEEITASHGQLAPQVSVECSSVELMIAISARSELLCWLPEPLLQPHLANGSMRKLAIPELEITRQFRVYRRKAGLLPDAARQFTKHLPMQGSGT
ncbi:LysR family transcriptional regulator [Novosphingobium jiangmenense]|uniref:LysR family transcriptional regulator n=1 Tax=Novosphingobium jiangmenense TaxID=2791981 RepID=A0ABS0HHT7_9SPHN|nr:LysR family transcriptional regulator [Novosphingobium jiangmenense]MBF9151539.1 LysR family transcriptional regulator [Novosphingobium jiangmenense]